MRLMFVALCFGLIVCGSNLVVAQNVEQNSDELRQQRVDRTLKRDHHRPPELREEESGAQVWQSDECEDPQGHASREQTRSLEMIDKRFCDRVMATLKGRIEIIYTYRNDFERGFAAKFAQAFQGERLIARADAIGRDMDQRPIYDGDRRKPLRSSWKTYLSWKNVFGAWIQ
jgi:hypothetical protein